MKKSIPLLIVLLLSLTGCGAAYAAICIGDEITQVQITHFDCGGVAEWTAEEEAVHRLQDWTDGLEYRPVTFKAGDSPSDWDGGEVYAFAWGQEDSPGFTYFICGPKSCYLRIGEGWYSVSNPSTPPVELPTP